MRKLKGLLYDIYFYAAFIVLMLPGLLVYALLLGSARLDYRIVGEWCQNEFLPAWGAAEILWTIPEFRRTQPINPY